MNVLTAYFKATYTPEKVTVEMTVEEMIAIKKLIGKTSTQDRLLLGLTGYESALCSQSYKTMRKALERLGVE